jgi:multiple sugar transport system permease protein
MTATSPSWRQRLPFPARAVRPDGATSTIVRASAAPGLPIEATPDAAVAPRPAVRRRRSNKPRRSPIEWLLVHAAFAVALLFFLAPFVWLMTAAFNTQADYVLAWPSPWTLDNFRTVVVDLDFSRYLRNSLIVSLSTMVLTTMTVALAGYSLSRLDIRRKTWITYSILLLQTMPLSATMVPIYGLARELHLRNNYWGLILIHTAIELPFLTWMMKNFFDAVPRYLEEAAWIDGRSKFRAWFEILLPMARPGLAVAAGLSFLSAWSEVLMVLVLVDDQRLITVPFAFYRAARGSGSYQEVDYGVIAALGILYVIPVLIMFFATRRLMVRGLMNSTRGL